VMSRSIKAAISLKRVKIEEKLIWGAYRNSPTLFRMVPFPTTYVPLSLDWRAPKTPITTISGTGKGTNFKFVCTKLHIIGSIGTKVH